MAAPRAITLVLSAALVCATSRFAHSQTHLIVFSVPGDRGSELAEGDARNRPVFSPDARRVAVIVSDWDAELHNLWVLGVDGHQEVQITDFEAGDAFGGSPAWSPDGREVAFQALRNGYYGIYRAPSDGSGDVELAYEHPSRSRRPSPKTPVEAP